jgi:hypothetical protein
MMIYLHIFLDVYINTLSLDYNSYKLVAKINSNLWQLPIFTNIILSHSVLLVIILIVASGANARKNIEYYSYKHFLYPFMIGGFFCGSSVMVILNYSRWTQVIFYGLTYLFGALALHVSFAKLTKRIKAKLKKDLWNTEEESFEQNTEFLNRSDIFNLPSSLVTREK